MCIVCVESVTAAVGAAAIAQRRFSLWQGLGAWWNRQTHRSQESARKHESSSLSAPTNPAEFEENLFWRSDAELQR